MKKLVFFGELVVQILEEDWDFVCKNRLFSENPDEADIRAEFVSGTGITPDKKHLWGQASERFTEYIQDLREISCLDINAMARNLLTEEEKYNEPAKSSDN